ncbi:uncharacterized protein [Lepeophtheirus salmonis]|uniref:uncharacterized protein isoform X1 n=2 Tax=Lepeophtheirus salmonis TaxID=72036 RepID=UPI003AF3C7F6
MMNSEHEMCQNCKRDIPVHNYRMHTIQCAGSVTTCPDCGDPVSKDLFDAHHQQFHSPRECPLCGISVQAVKLYSHKKNDCPKRNVCCKYCQIQKIASEMMDHETRCGSVSKSCPECASLIPLKDLESHKLHHKNKEEMYKLTERTHGYSRETRSSKEYKSQTLPRTSNISNLSSDANTLLPCEFCEEMVPMFKLLEHQAECVNPSNVRGGNSNNPAIIRSHSMYTTGTSSSSSNNSNINKRYGTDNTEVVLRRKLNSSNRYDSYDSRKDSSIDDNEEYLPCEFCGQSFLPDYIMKHQMSCDQNPHPSKFPSRRASSYLSPSSSINREGRACTEDRQLRPLGGSLSRQGSFTTSSRQRRGESLTRQSSFSRNYLSQRSSYDYTSPSASSIRRASIFDGYSGFAIYSSISQGLDEITYGGRRSRRNSITESSYTRTSDNSFALPTLLAMQTASGATPTTPVSPNPRSNSSASNNNSNNSDPFRFPSSSSSSTEYRSSIVRRDSENSSHHKNSPKVKRNVSFTGEKPVVINDTPPHSQVTENAGNEEKRIAMERSIEREKKKEPSPHLNLFDEINDKLKLLEVEQQQKRTGAMLTNSSLIEKRLCFGSYSNLILVSHEI